MFDWAMLCFDILLCNAVIDMVHIEQHDMNYYDAMQHTHTNVYTTYHDCKQAAMCVEAQHKKDHAPEVEKKRSARCADCLSETLC